MMRTKKALLRNFVTAMAMVVFLFCGKTQDQPQVPEGRIVPMKEYTADNAREWGNLTDEHVPTARKSLHEGKKSLLIEVKNLKTDFSHYIEKFGVMDVENREIVSISIERGNAPPNFGYVALDLLPRSGNVKIFAKCNLHDLWVETVDISDIK